MQAMKAARLYTKITKEEHNIHEMEFYSKYIEHISVATGEDKALNDAIFIF